jgi:hypothetical protein
LRNCSSFTRFLLKDALGALLILFCALPASAQGGYVLGTALNLTGGGSSQPPNSSSAPTTNSLSTTFYGIHPSISISSARPNSSVGANYAFGFDRTGGIGGRRTGSHTASVNLGTTPGPRWTVGLSDSFSMSSDLNTFNALSGVVTPQPGAPLFSPVGTGQSRKSNRANFSLGWTFDPTSTLSFVATHTLTKYGSSATLTTPLATQQHYSGSVNFKQQLGLNDSWNISYTAGYFDPGNSPNSISQSAQAGYSMMVFRDWTLQFGAGLSQVNSQGTAGGNLSYDAAASIGRSIQSNTFSLSYSQDSTEPIGVGSTFTTQRASLSWNRSVGKITPSASVSAYESKGTLGNTLDVKGISANANIGFPLSQTLSISAGATYQATKGVGAFDFIQKRAFLALRYSQPKLKTFH